MDMAQSRKLNQDESALLRVEYGRRLREARKAAGYETLVAAAEKAGVNETVFRQWELGRSTPAMASLDLIVTRLGLDPAILFRGPDHRSKAEEPGHARKKKS